MDYLLKKYLPQIEFATYEEFREKLTINVPEDFNFAYPLGHIVTAKYWQHVEENRLHMSVSDSGWAKFGWGKIYGQWICGGTVTAITASWAAMTTLSSAPATVSDPLRWNLP